MKPNSRNKGLKARYEKPNMSRTRKELETIRQQHSLSSSQPKDTIQTNQSANFGPLSGEIQRKRFVSKELPAHFDNAKINLNLMRHQRISSEYPPNNKSKFDYNPNLEPQTLSQRNLSKIKKNYLSNPIYSPLSQKLKKETEYDSLKQQFDEFRELVSQQLNFMQEKQVPEKMKSRKNSQQKSHDRSPSDSKTATKNYSKSSRRQSSVSNNISNNKFKPIPRPVGHNLNLSRTERPKTREKYIPNVSSRRGYNRSKNEQLVKQIARSISRRSSIVKSHSSKSTKHQERRRAKQLKTEFLRKHNMTGIASFGAHSSISSSSDSISGSASTQKTRSISSKTKNLTHKLQTHLMNTQNANII